MADTKLSQIADGGAYVPATDQFVTVRSGTTDLLVNGVAAGPGASTAHNLAAFSGTDGRTLEDSGVATSNVATLSGAQTFITGLKKFTNSLLGLLGSSTGYTVFTSDNAGATNYTLHVPAANDTLTLIGAAQTLSAKTLASPIITGAAPANASATGTAGTVLTDSGFIYVCTATNTWKRVAIATW